MRPLRVAAAVLALLVVAAPAKAGPSTWTHWILTGDPASELSDAWVRAFLDDAGTLYAGSEGDGVFRSNTAGVQWSPVSDGLTGDARNIRSLSSIGGTIYTGTSAGLFKLSGSSWLPVGQAPDTEVGKRLDKPVQALLSTGGSILAGVASGGVYRSADGGATWTKPAPGNGMTASETVWGLSAHPVTPSLVLAATSGGVYRSSDGGGTWSLASDGIPYGVTTLRVVVHQAAPNVYFAATTGGVYRSVNAGVTWAPVSTGLTNDVVRGVFLQSVKRMYAATENGVFASNLLDLEDPFLVRWHPITKAGLGTNTIFWGLIDGFAGPNTLIGGTQSDGVYHVTLEPPSNDGKPTIVGAAQVGTTLQAHVGSWSGTGAISFTYQWFNCSPGCNPISDQTDDQYVVRSGDVGDKLLVHVTAVNAFPTAAVSEDSAQTATVVANPNSADLPGSLQNGTPSITGPSLPQPGDTLTAVPGTQNPAPTSRTYQWLRCDDAGSNCDPIGGPVALSDYLLTESDVDHRLRVIVTGTNATGSRASAASAETNLIFPPQALNTVAPAIAGQPYPGSTLVGSVGTWASPRTIFERRWMRCNGDGGSCEYLSGETASAYLVKDGDLGSRLKLEVNADTNSANVFPSGVSVDSPPSEPIVARPPEPTPVPTAVPTAAATVPAGGASAGGAGGPGGADVRPPVIGGLKALARSFKAGTPLRFSMALSEAGTVTAVFERLTPGRRKGAKCVKPTRKLRKAKKCTRATAVGKPVTRPAGAGAATLAFATSRKLKPGRYQVRLVARDAAGNLGAVATAGYVVSRPRRR